MVTKIEIWDLHCGRWGTLIAYFGWYLLLSCVHWEGLHLLALAFVLAYLVFSGGDLLRL